MSGERGTWVSRVREAMTPVPMNKAPGEPEIDMVAVVGFGLAASWLVAVLLAMEVATSLIVRLLIVAAIVGAVLGMGWAVSWLRREP